MAFPFGSTSYGQYALWAQSVGCECNFGHDPISNLPCLRIVAPSGRKLHVADVDQLERLTTSTLNYLDRRLGLRSPFPRAHYGD